MVNSRVRQIALSWPGSWASAGRTLPEATPHDGLFKGQDNPHMTICSSATSRFLAIRKNSVLIRA
jgi:hypothetical protein